MGTLSKPARDANYGATGGCVRGPNRQDGAHHLDFAMVEFTLRNGDTNDATGGKLRCVWGRGRFDCEQSGNYLRFSKGVVKKHCL